MTLPMDTNEAALYSAPSMTYTGVCWCCNADLTGTIRPAIERESTPRCATPGCQGGIGLRLTDTWYKQNNMTPPPAPFGARRDPG